jgi:hypothetical protein
MTETVKNTFEIAAINHNLTLLPNLIRKVKKKTVLKTVRKFLKSHDPNCQKETAKHF